MLLITKKFCIRVTIANKDILERKLKELHITPISKRYSEFIITDKCVSRDVFYECMENLETLDTLIEYLKKTILKE